MRNFIAALFFVPFFAHACPNVDKINDFNCDGEVVVTVLGDSIAYGFADTANGNKGGYVLRAAKALPDVTFHNDGDPGQRTFELLESLEDAFTRGKNDKLKHDLLEADIVIIDEGRNDRWFFGPTLKTYRNLKRAAAKIRSSVAAIQGSAPMVVTAVMILPNRGSQGPWVKELNGEILAGSKRTAPADLRFDLVSKRLLSKDQIHPTPKGYSAMAKVLVKYLTKTLQPVLLSLRPDSDNDGLPNIFEPSKFGTLANNPDTDGDGKSDGDEVFVTHTNPLAAD